MESNSQPNSARTVLTQEAWIGDAVLCLFARLKILRENGLLDGPKCVRMTSNKFLGTVGEPTKVEAEVGRLFMREGLDKAFEYIETYLMPMFERQEQNRLRRTGHIK